MDFLWKGLILGFSIAAPVGPIGLLCIKRTLIEGRTHGFVSGLGAATADAFYGFIAAFGLSAVSSFLLEYRLPIHIAGGFFLFFLAGKIFLTPPPEGPAPAKVHAPLWRSYTSTFFLTLTNPTTILSFLALFAGLGIVGSGGSYINSSLLIAGVLLGSALWWLALSGGVGFFRKDFGRRGLTWINRISGILIALVGLWSISGLSP